MSHKSDVHVRVGLCILWNMIEHNNIIGPFFIASSQCCTKQVGHTTRISVTKLSGRRSCINIRIGAIVYLFRSAYASSLSVKHGIFSNVRNRMIDL